MQASEDGLEEITIKMEIMDFSRLRPFGMTKEGFQFGNKHALICRKGCDILKVNKLAVIAITGCLCMALECPFKASQDDDLYILSHIICGEAEGCSEAMKRSVGSVVLNRVNDPRFPNTIEEVAFQEGQYSCTWDGNYYREPSQETIDIAKELLEDGSAIDESVVWQAEFIQGNGVYDQIGNMYFCY